MQNLSRRDVVSGLSALALVGVSSELGGQVHASEAPVPRGVATPQVGPADGAAGQGGAAAAGSGLLASSRVFGYGEMAVRTSASGESRTITHGVLATGETVHLHESAQKVGAVPVALHVIQHSEFVCVSDGELEFQHEVEGKVVAEKASAGSVIYVALGTNHRVVNTGAVPAKYFVVGIGGDAK